MKLICAPQFPGGYKVVEDKSDAILKRPTGLVKEVNMAKTASAIDFLYYREQTYPRNPWSV